MNGVNLEGSLQDNVLTLLLFSDTGYSTVRASVDVSLFTSQVYRDIVTRAYAYIDQYNKPPKDHIADEMEDMLSKEGEHAALIAHVLRSARELTATINEHYVLESLDRFVRQQALKVGIVKAHEALQRGDVEGAEQEWEKATERRAASFAPGLTLLESIRMLSSQDQPREVLTVGITEVDKRHLGPAKKELHLLIAPPKRGKSWWLVHCAKRAMMQRWKVVYITLELADLFVGRRMLMSLFAAKTREDAGVVVTRFTRDAKGQVEGIRQVERNRPTIDTPEKIAALASRVEGLHINDRLRIKNFPTGSLTLSGLNAYLDQLDKVYHFVPDLIVLDYADLMDSGAGLENFRLGLGRLFVGIRGVAGERNAAIATATQSTKAGAKARLLRETDVAEDWSKIATVDAVVTYNQTTLEQRFGLARLYFAAGRTEADRFSVVIPQNYTTGQFALDSCYMRDEYWSFLPKQAEEEQGDDD